MPADTAMILGGWLTGDNVVVGVAESNEEEDISVRLGCRYAGLNRTNFARVVTLDASVFE